MRRMTRSRGVECLGRRARWSRAAAHHRHRASHHRRSRRRQRSRSSRSRGSNRGGSHSSSSGDRSGSYSGSGVNRRRIATGWVFPLCRLPAFTLPSSAPESAGAASHHCMFRTSARISPYRRGAAGIATPAAERVGAAFHRSAGRASARIPPYRRSVAEVATLTSSCTCPATCRPASCWRPSTRATLPITARRTLVSYLPVLPRGVRDAPLSRSPTLRQSFRDGGGVAIRRAGIPRSCPEFTALWQCSRCGGR